MRLKWLIMALLLLYTGIAGAQNILVDRGLRAEGLWCFPLVTDTLTYLYLPNSGRLALDEDSLPQFSFMRYVTEKPGSGTNGATINEAGGGAVLHFLVLYDTPDRQIRAAEARLRMLLQNPAVKLRGPVVFSKGRYALISSIIEPESGEEKEVLIGTGEAPVLENSRIALSFGMTPQQSKILLESFKMATPDISIVFELTFTGLSDAYQAEVEFDWSEVRNTQNFSAGGSIYFVSADVELGLKELVKKGNIRLKTAGESSQMEGLLNVVYDKLVKVLFDPVEPESLPAEAAGGMTDALSTLLSPTGPLGSRSTTGFGVNVAYQLKMLNASGTGRLSFNGRSSIERRHFITFNIGNLWQRFGDDERLFRDVPLYDPAFQQREVFIGIDGSLEKEFDRMVNSVTVTIRKVHENGAETLKEVLINRQELKKFEKPVSVLYLNQKDADRQKWLSYECRQTWNFINQGNYSTPWQAQTGAMVNVFTPYERRSIGLEGDLGALQAKGVRAVSVQITYPFFGVQKQERLTIRPTDDLSSKAFEVTLPQGHDEVAFALTWIMADGTKKTKEGTDNLGIIFIDELP